MRFFSKDSLSNEEHRLSVLSQTKLLVDGCYIDCVLVHYTDPSMENSKRISFKLIAATCEGNGIGKDNDLPWSLKSEMDYFTRMTTSTTDSSKQNALIMGRLVGVKLVLMVAHNSLQEDLGVYSCLGETGETLPGQDQHRPHQSSQG